MACYSYIQSYRCICPRICSLSCWYL